MNIEKLNNLLSVIANIGVLFGIFVLVVEVSQNTQAIQTEAVWSRASQQTELALAMIENPEFSELKSKFDMFSADQVREAQVSSPGEFQRYAQYWSAHRIFYESRYITQTSDLERNVLRDNIAFNLGSRPGAEYMVSRINSGESSRGTAFQLFVQEILDELH